MKNRKLWIFLIFVAIAGGLFQLLRSSDTPEFVQTVTPEVRVQENVMQVVRKGCESAARNNPGELKTLTLNLDSMGAREFWKNMTSLPELEWDKAVFSSPKNDPEFVYIKISGKDGSTWIFELKGRKGTFKFQSCRKLNS